MLSDAIREAKTEVERCRRGGVALDGIVVDAVTGILDIWAADAADMEARLEALTGRPRVPLTTQLRLVGGAE
jgi:hypothetical protein